MPNFAELFRKKINDLQSLLDDERHKTRAFEIIRSMITKFTISEGEKKGQPVMELEGSLAHILSYAQTGMSAEECRSLMVAGARKQRQPTKISVKIE